VERLGRVQIDELTAHNVRSHEAEELNNSGWQGRRRTIQLGVKGSSWEAPGLKDSMGDQREQAMTQLLKEHAQEKSQEGCRPQEANARSTELTTVAGKRTRGTAM
jgi:hypothetical protein